MQVAFFSKEIKQSPGKMICSRGFKLAILRIIIYRLHYIIATLSRTQLMGKIRIRKSLIRVNYFI